MADYLTIGQVARRLRVSVSTLKRWVSESQLHLADRRNQCGWRLFSENELESLRDYKREQRKNGRRFQDTTLIPIIENGRSVSRKEERVLAA